jgi:IS5 family transposase
LQHSIRVWLRRRGDEANGEVLAITGQLADLATAAVDEAANALTYKTRRRKVRRLLDHLAVLIERTARLIDQARARVNGDQPAGASRLVSLHEPDARPIRKGRLGKPVEFGYKAQVVDNPDGLILDHSVHIGNPADNELLRPAVERITTQLGVAPSLVTADRGYWDSTVEADLAAGGVATVVIPRTRKPSAARAAIEHADMFVAAVKWRTGSERDAFPTSNATGNGDAPDCAAIPACGSAAVRAYSLITSSSSSK